METETKGEREMMLDDAAILVAAVNTAENREQERLLYDFLVESKTEIEEFCSLLYGPAILKPEHIMSALHRGLGMFPEEFELIEGTPLVPALVSESPDECEDSMTIPEALSCVSELRVIETAPDIRAIFAKMDKRSAEALWCRALGERPVLPRKRLLRAVAHGGGRYPPERLTSALAVENIAVVLERAIDGTLSDEFRIQPGHPFRAPSFGPWKYWSVPFLNTYYEIVSGPRRYAHQVDGKVFVYDGMGELVPNAPVEMTHGGDCVVLVDEEGDVIEWLHSEANPDQWEMDYRGRAVNPQRVRDAAHLRALSQNLEDGEVLRLIDGDKPHIHGQHRGGFIQPKRIYEMPLLITQAREQKNGEWIDLRIEALDGFDPIHVGYANVKRENLPNNPILTEGCKRKVWTELETPLVGLFHALRCVGYRLEGAYLVRIDTGLGISDALQYGDIIEREGNGQAR